MYAVARHCQSLVALCVGVSWGEGADITDASIMAVARSCRKLIYIDVDDTDLTNDGASVIASSCLNLQFAHVRGTRVTAAGATALAQRIAWAKQASGGRVEKLPVRINHGQTNLCPHRLPDDVPDDLLLTLAARFPSLSIFGLITPR